MGAIFLWNINEVFNVGPRTMCLEASCVHPSLVINDLPRLEKKPCVGSLSARLPFAQPKTNTADLGRCWEHRAFLAQGNSFFLYA